MDFNDFCVIPRYCYRFCCHIFYLYFIYDDAYVNVEYYESYNDFEAFVDRFLVSKLLFRMIKKSVLPM